MLDLDNLVHDKVVDLLVAGDDDLLLGVHHSEQVPLSGYDVRLLHLSDLHQLVHNVLLVSWSYLDEYECLLKDCQLVAGSPIDFKNSCAAKMQL